MKLTIDDLRKYTSRRKFSGDITTAQRAFVKTIKSKLNIIINTFTEEQLKSANITIASKAVHINDNFIKCFNALSLNEQKNLMTATHKDHPLPDPNDPNDKPESTDVTDVVLEEKPTSTGILTPKRAPPPPPGEKKADEKKAVENVELRGSEYDEGVFGPGPANQTSNPVKKYADKIRSNAYAARYVIANELKRPKTLYDTTNDKLPASIYTEKVWAPKKVIDKAIDNFQNDKLIKVGSIRSYLDERKQVQEKGSLYTATSRSFVLPSRSFSKK